MAKLRVHNFSISLDGFGAGPNQSVEEPLGVGGESLHEWMYAIRSARKQFGWEGGETGIDDDVWLRGNLNIGAWILGRNMFGPIRGEWPDDEWKGWWGEEPPYHGPVFVLTHYPRDPVPMKGGTTFHFVTDGIEAARERAVEAADGKDVLIGGGASTIRQYMGARLVDVIHVAISPLLLGSGERLFEGLDEDTRNAYECVEVVSSPRAAHVTLERK